MSERSGAGVRAIDHVGVTVPDIEAAARFFADALGAEPLYEMAPTQPATRRKSHDSSRRSSGPVPAPGGGER